MGREQNSRGIPEHRIGSYIDSVAEEIQKAFPGIKGFNRRGLYRMKKFYETNIDKNG